MNNQRQVHPEIVQYKNDPRSNILRKKCKEVPPGQIKSPEIQSTIQKMFEVLKTQKDGVAIAANQINKDWQIFVISPELSQDPQTGLNINKLVYINPKIIKKSKKTHILDEGCLSVRWLYGKTKRHKNVTIQAYDENGTLFTRGAGGLLAQIYQHETDHLNGILFCDHATDLKEFKPEQK